MVVSSTHQPAVYPSAHRGQVRNGVTPAGHLPVNSLCQRSREQVSSKSWRPDLHQLTLAWHLPQCLQCSEPWLCPPDRSGSALRGQVNFLRTSSTSAIGEWLPLGSETAILCGVPFTAYQPVPQYANPLQIVLYRLNSSCSVYSVVSVSQVDPD